MGQRHVFFVTCAPGLEPVLHAEAKALRFSRLERQVGGVRFEGGIEDAWTANLRLRTATRVLLRIARFPAADDETLHRRAMEVDWADWIGPEGTLAVAAKTNESALDHTRFVEQRVKDAIVDRVRADRGRRPSVDRDDPDLRIDVHLFRDRATLSIDTSGEPLFKRGWRVHQGRAPLSESLAAGIVQMSGWDRRSPLVDPFCGSGTLLIEAALLALDRAPGSFGRRFAFQRLPNHDAKRFEAMRCALEPVNRPSKLRLFGFDWDKSQIEGARANAEAAGVASVVTFEQRAVRDLDLRAGWNAWIVSNPPYGERVGNREDLPELYREFGAYCRENLAGYHMSLLSGDPKLTKALGLKASNRTSLENGGLPVELVDYEFNA